VSVDVLRDTHQLLELFELPREERPVLLALCETLLRDLVLAVQHELDLRSLSAKLRVSQVWVPASATVGNKDPGTHSRMARSCAVILGAPGRTPIIRHTRCIASVLRVAEWNEK